MCHLKRNDPAYDLDKRKVELKTELQQVTKRKAELERWKNEQEEKLIKERLTQQLKDNISSLRIAYQNGNVITIDKRQLSISVTTNLGYKMTIPLLQLLNKHQWTSVLQHGGFITKPIDHSKETQSEWKKLKSKIMKSEIELKRFNRLDRGVYPTMITICKV